MGRGGKEVVACPCKLLIFRFDFGLLHAAYLISHGNANNRGDRGAERVTGGADVGLTG